MVNVNFGKKAQVKMQQTAFMLIALTLLFVLVGMFILSISLSNLKESKEKLNEENAMLLALSLSNYPELSCGNSFGGDRSYCIDADKFMALKKVAEKDYEKFWKISGIEIRKIYNESTVVCTESNYPNCGILRMFSSSSEGSDKTSFITLCRKERHVSSFYNKCEIAKLIVRFEDVQ